MKIVCDNCATKYSIADEKVRGKVFKIRCKKCSHIIVVRGGADGSVEATSSRDAGPADGGFPGGGGEEQQTIAARGGAEPSGDAVWHLVIDREQVGPLAPSEVRAKFAGGEVDAETYAWREGFGDWLRLGSIEDFRDLGGDAPAAPEATRRTDSADLFGGGGGGDDAGDAPAGDLFGGGAAPAPAYSSAPAPSANEDVFGGGGGGALFSAPSAAPQRQSRASSPAFAASSASAESAPSSGHGNGNVVDVRPMTGQRNENSVLFSLNNLQALATGGAGGGKSAPSGGSENRPGFANSQTEGSGLIDIRAMAASTLAASPSTGGGLGSGPGELPGLGAAPVFSPMAAPILMPAAASGPPKWMWAILGVGGLAVVGIIVVGILLLTRKPLEQPVAQQAAAPTAPATTAPVAAAPNAAAKPAATPAAPTAAAPAAAAATPAAPAAEKHPGKAPKGEKTPKLAKNEPAAAKAPAAAPEPAAAPAAAAPAPKHAGGKRDELDDLLNNASPGDTPKQHKAAAAAAKEDSGGGASDDSLPDSLDKGQIVSGMSKVKGRVQGCFDQYKVPGTASVAITISPSGRVSAANVTGQFAGTPTGECVAKAVKTAGFTRFKGAPMSFVYPYLLR